MSTTSASPSLTCAELAEQLLYQFQLGKSAVHLPAPDPGNRRKTARRNFTCWQLVAEYDGKRLPVQQDFQLRFCQDISAGGISYLAAERPKSEELIIALGAIPFVFFHVRVIWAKRRKNFENEPLLIGCRFIKRIKG